MNLLPNEEQLDALNNKIEFRTSELLPGTYRTVEEDDENLVNVKVPDQTDIDNITREIKDAYKKGVSIAPFAETTPLIPLYELLKTDIPAPLKVQSEKQNYEFYLVQVIFNILLPEDQYPLNADFHLNILDDVKQDHRKSRPIRLFPDRKDITLFKLDLEGALGVDAEMNILSLLDNTIPSIKDFNADAKIKARLLIGPFSFQYRKAALEVKGESDYNIQWRYNLKSELTGTNKFTSVIILKVAKEAKSVYLESILSVIPYKKHWHFWKDKLDPISSNKKLIIEIK